MRRLIAERALGATARRGGSRRGAACRWAGRLGGALVLAALAACGNGGVDRNGDVVGGPCTDGSQCAGGSTCLVASMYPGGMCTVACDTQADCPRGTACVQESGGTCLLACSSAGDCREGYDCIEKSARPSGHAFVCIR